MSNNEESLFRELLRTLFEARNSDIKKIVAKNEHIEMLRRNDGSWLKWTVENVNTIIDFNQKDLSGIDFRDQIFSDDHLFSGANLSKCRFSNNLCDWELKKCGLIKT